MKKLGLIGGTGPESTAIYYKEINRLVNEATDGREFPEIAIESVSLTKALGYVAEEKYEQLTQYFQKRVDNLIQGGAEVVALTAATMHVIYEDLQQHVKVPFVSIPETVSQVAVAKGYKKVGLLGTIFTMQKDCLKKSFWDKDIQVVIPSEKDMVLVNERITKELEYGIVKDSTRDELLHVIRKMQEQDGIEALILGCTELPLILDSTNCPVACLDIMGLHIKKLVELICDEK